jgi:hypothetical protein
MMDPRLSQLDAAVGQLSLEEQLWLMERLIQRIRERSLHGAQMNDDEIERMAEDPAIQRELREIEAEFAHTEHDGLDAYS